MVLRDCDDDVIKSGFTRCRGENGREGSVARRNATINLPIAYFTLKYPEKTAVRIPTSLEVLKSGHTNIFSISMGVEGKQKKRRFRSS